MAAVRSLSEMLAARRAVVAAWRDGLPSEELAEYENFRASAKAAALARREARKARQGEREAFDRRIVQMVMRGLTSDEMAAETGLPTREVQRAVARLGFDKGRPRWRRLPAIQVPAETRERIDAIAAERGASAAETIATLLIFAFEDDAFHARRLLRVGAGR